jgi:serine/threonine protein kinase
LRLLLRIAALIWIWHAERIWHFAARLSLSYLSRTDGFRLPEHTTCQSEGCSLACLVINRDIEPQQRSGDPRRCTHKLLDFGIAKILGSGRRGGNEPGAGDAA